MALPRLSGYLKNTNFIRISVELILLAIVIYVLGYASRFYPSFLLLLLSLYFTIAIMIETIVSKSPSAEPYARLARLYTSQKGEPMSDIRRIIFSFDIQKAPVCRSTPAIGKRSRALRFMMQIATPAATITEFISINTALMCRLINGLDLRWAIIDDKAPRISRTAPAIAPSNKYCKM